MKAVLISIQPKWVEKIVNGEKTIEVRKSRPKIDTPFKCYIYCTNGLVMYGNGKQYVTDSSEFLRGSAVEAFENSSCFCKWNGKVIGEFVCDRIDISVVELKPNDIEPCYWKLINGSCLTKNELMNYGKYNALYGWHISNLKIYDKPKELGEFGVPCMKINEIHCRDCKINDKTTEFCYKQIKPLNRPPQSWYYVEEL